MLNAVRELSAGLNKELFNTSVEILFEKFDANRDGVIAEEEFMDCLNRYPDLMKQLLPMKSI